MLLMFTDDPVQDAEQYAVDQEERAKYLKRLEKQKRRKKERQRRKRVHCKL